MAMCLIYRGDLSPARLNPVVFEPRNRRMIEFAEWVHNGIKCGVNQNTIVKIPGDDIGVGKHSFTYLMNRTATKESFVRFSNRFDILNKKKVFLPRLISEGMEESELNDAREEIA